jgi:hypothetical protein
LPVYRHTHDVNRGNILDALAINFTNGKGFETVDIGERRREGKIKIGAE